MSSRWDSSGRSVGGTEMMNVNVEVTRAQNVQVAAGATVTVIPTTPVPDIRRVWAYAVCKSAEAHSMTLKIEYAHVNGTAGMYPNAAAATSVGVTAMNRVNVPQTDLPCGYVYVTLTNQDTVNHNYDVVLGGIK
ncbi:hypothetical protein [Paenibacillus sp. RUD330]|uniref:hypothetical protein n=1 Tax=Paenibacillus sp. RUD330 TaxID=2023772 RepID=UPI000B929C61|nr:hypothetical protein [Paenibacillus sp. RUD330]ASS66219.1 hypothetical protein CIC07_08705 [Paenibacillus sp. RUD330]